MTQLSLANLRELTLASEDLSAPSSIVLASSCLRTIPYIAAVTRELTHCIVIILCSTPRASKPYSIQRCWKRWTRDSYMCKKKIFVSGTIPSQIYRLL